MSGWLFKHRSIGETRAEHINAEKQDKKLRGNASIPQRSKTVAKQASTSKSEHDLAKKAKHPLSGSSDMAGSCGNWPCSRTNYIERRWLPGLKLGWLRKESS